MIAPLKEAPAVQARKDLAGAGFRAAVAEVAEVPERVLRPDGDGLALDQGFVVFLNGGEGAGEAKPRVQNSPMIQVMVG